MEDEFPEEDISPLRDPDNDQQDRPLVAAPFAVLTTTNVSIMCLMWHIILITWNLIDYLVWIRRAHHTLNELPWRAYIAFVVISHVLVYGVMAPMLIYSGKYVASRKNKNRFLSLALCLGFLFSDVPFFAIEISIYRRYGQRHVVQMVCVILRCISFVTGAFTFWVVLMHHGSRLLYSIIPNSDVKLIIARDRRNMERQRGGVTVPYPFATYKNHRRHREMTARQARAERKRLEKQLTPGRY